MTTRPAATARPATRERLLDAADRLMWERGYEAVGIAELCAEAGAPKGSFYHWWPSKAALAEAMLERAWARVRTTLFQPTFGGEGPFAARLEGYTERLAASHWLVANQGEGVRGCRFGNFATELSTRDPVIRARIAAVFDEMVAIVAAAIEEARATGELGPGVEPAQAATAVIAHMEGLMVLAKAGVDPGLIDRLATDGRRLVGLDPSPPVATRSQTQGR